MKKTAKPVLEDRAATPAEIEAAVDELSDADWYRLRNCAERLEFALQERAMGREILGEAFERLLSGSRKLDKTKAGLVAFRFGAMRSICNAWFRAKRNPTERPSLASSLSVEDEERHTSNSVDDYATLEPSAEGLLVFRETLVRVDEVLADDQEARMILGGLETDVNRLPSVSCGALPNTVRHHRHAHAAIDQTSWHHDFQLGLLVHLGELCVGNLREVPGLDLPDLDSRWHGRDDHNTAVNV
ncbi:MAG: hypothetical protein ACLQBJ_15065 [Bryobacteraceae bacterium]